MNDVMNKTKKLFTSAVAAATIASSVSMSALLAPLAAKAAIPPAGSLVKASLPAVYYLGTDGKRYVFPNETTYKTWYADFSGVVVITDAELASLPIGGNVTMRPGVLMVKITTDPKVYAVDAHGCLRWVTSEAVAVALYGSAWNTMVRDVPDAFFTNYSSCADINSASDFNRTAVTSAASSINVDKNLGSGGITGTVSVMGGSQPAGGTVPFGATAVNVLRFDVKNTGSAAASVSSLTVKRSGPGEADDFANIFVYQGSTRVTTGRTVNTSTNEATFSGLNMSIPAGGTSTIWIAADWADNNVDAEAGNVNMFTLTNLMVGGNTATGTPVSGPSFTTAGVGVGEVDIDDAGSISSVKAGGKQQKVATFRLTAPANEDMDFSSIALMQNGSANRSDIANLTLKQAGLTLATTAALTDKDLAVFALSSPMYMERGATRTFEVFADISAATDPTDDFEFTLDEDSDLHATGRTYGYGLTVDSGAFTAQTVDVEAGKLTTTFNGPASKDVAVNGKDVELFNFTVAAQSNLEIRQTTIRVTIGGGSDVVDVIRDLKLIDTGSGALLAGPKDGTAASATQDFLFTEFWNLNAGQTRTVKVTADIVNDSGLDGDTIQVTLGDVPNGDLWADNKVRNLDGSDYLGSADMVPNAPIVGNTNTINDSSLEISASSTPVAQTYIQGTANASLAGFGLQAGDAGDVKVNSLVFQGYIDDNDGNGDMDAGSDVDDGESASISNSILSVKLWNGSTQIGETEAPTNAGVVTFDNLNLTIPSGQTVNVTLSASLAGSIASVNDGGDDDDFVQWSLDDGDVDATNVDGDTITATGGTEYSNVMTIARNGSLTAVRAPDDTESEAANVVGGANNAVLAKIKFTAQREEIKVTKTLFYVDGEGVSTLSLYDGSTLVGGPVAVNGSNEAIFTGVNFIVPKDGSKTLTVKGNLNSVGSSGADTGTDVTVTLDYNDGFEARGTGAGSSTTINFIDANNNGVDDGCAPDCDITGREKILRKTKPVISLVSLPSTTLVAGDVTALRFTVTADAAGDVAIRGFRVNLVSGATLAEVNGGTDSSVRRVGDGANRPGYSTLVGSVLDVVFTDEEVVAAGSSRTYDVRINVSGLGGNDSLSSNLLGDTSVDTDSIDDTGTNSYVEIDGTEYNFVWSDISEIPHSDVFGSSSFDWTNGTYVKTLPTDTQTLQE